MQQSSTTQSGYHQRKAHVLAQLGSGEIDKSPKGFIDAHIADLCHWINKHPKIYTTSSCSGRITLFLHGDETKGGDWLLATHDLTTEAEIADSLLKLIPYDMAQEYGFGKMYPNGQIPDKYKDNQDNNNNNDNNIIQKYPLTSDSTVYFRFEGAILCAETIDLDTASKFTIVAHESGYRESGITSITTRFVVNVRGALRFDIPIILNGKLMVSIEYLQELVKLGNMNMEMNWAKVDKFWKNLEKSPYFTHDPSIAAQVNNNNNNNTNDVNNINDISNKVSMYCIAHRSNIKPIKDYFKALNFTDRSCEVEVLKTDAVGNFFTPQVGSDGDEKAKIENFINLDNPAFGLFTLNTAAKTSLFQYSIQNQNITNIPTDKDGNRITTIKLSELISICTSQSATLPSQHNVFEQLHQFALIAAQKEKKKAGNKTDNDDDNIQGNMKQTPSLSELINMYDFYIMFVLRGVPINREEISKQSVKGSKPVSQKGKFDKNNPQNVNTNTTSSSPTTETTFARHL